MRVVVGLSGGVDSSVAALLLKEQGHEVIGIFMRNWHDDSVIINAECPWIEDSNDAMMVCQQLDIPFQTLDLSSEYKKRIVDYMFSEYARGRTPNPDVLCNREIKFDLFLQTAVQAVQADAVATGHYARITSSEEAGEPTYRLLSGVDTGKDQSYFLCQLHQEQLAKSLFPIGHLTKAQVRKKAEHAGLVTSTKKDSQGLCFIGKVHLPVFLQQQLSRKNGDVILIPTDARQLQPNLSATLRDMAQPYPYHPADGRIIGEHDGAHFYTIGQRRGLHIGGFAEPLFVLATDVSSNTVYVGMGEHHPGLYRPVLFINRTDIHWLSPKNVLSAGQSLTCKARVRYRQPLEACTLHQLEDGLYMRFARPQRGITPGQFAVWYDETGNELLGSGVIAF